MQDFEILIKKAIEKLPKNIREKIENTAICVEDAPTKEQLEKIRARKKHNILGLYEGIPKNTWGRGFGNNLPDKITIFRESIERASSNSDDMEELIRNVVWHEVAHHFGFDEKEARRLDLERID